MAYEEIKNSGITSDTPKNIIFGAGTIHKGLKYTSGAWNFAESLIGATQGGGKFTITPEYTDIEADGATVKVKGLAQKVGESASMEVSFLEITPDVLAMGVGGETADSTSITGYTEIKSKAKIEEGDYIENLGFIGKTLEGKPIIVIFDYARCTSGVEIESKNKENATIKATFECYQDLTEDTTVLPYHIYFPKSTT